MLSPTPSSTGGLPSYVGYPQFTPAVDDQSPTVQPVVSYPTLLPMLERPPLTVSSFSLNHPTPEIYPTLPTIDPAVFYNSYMIPRTPYLVPIPMGAPVIQDQGPIEFLKQSLDQVLPGFTPHPDSHDCDHIIHQKLFDLLSRFLTSCENWPLDKKIEQCEKAVAEIVYGLMPQEQKKSYELLSLWSRLPKYELLEIAVRNHLFQGMLLQQKTLIADVYRRDKKFLSDLGDREAGLLNFATKNNQYCTPYFEISSLMVNHNLLDDLLKDTISQAPDHLPLDASIIAYEKLVSSKLKELQLENSSQTSNYFEYNLRDALSRKLISKQAQVFKEKFLQKDTFTAEEMRAAVEQIVQFAKYGNPEILLLIETFELDAGDISPFDTVRSSILVKQEQLIQNLSSNRTEPGFWAKLIHKKEPSLESCVAAIQAHIMKQLETVDWAEQRWLELQTPIPIMPIHDLPVTPSAPPPELAPPIPDQIPVYTPPPSPILTPPPIVDLPTPPSPPPVDSPVIHPPISERVVDLTPHAPEPVLVRATDLSIPLVSYVGLAFDDLLKNPNDQETWKSLPEVVQIDVLRHTFHYKSCEGKAEDVARRLFKTTPALQRQFTALSKKPHSIETKALSEEFVNTGVKLLELYYSPKAIKEPYHFIQEFKKLPKEPRFFQYVYEMAKSAGVHIEPWDHHFAEYNWDRPGMIALSVQALERCLHTTPRGGA